MPSFSSNSKRKLATCDQQIQEVLNEAIKYFDFSCIWGHRGKEDQNRAYREGNSTLQWPNSGHNAIPARAVDVIPYPGGFDNEDAAFYGDVDISREQSTNGNRGSYSHYHTSPNRDSWIKDPERFRQAVVSQPGCTVGTVFYGRTLH